MLVKVYKLKQSRKIIVFLAVIALGVAADQITKSLAVKALENKGFVKVIGDFFGFELVRNPGAFLGLFSTNRWLFMIPSAIAIVLLSVWLYRKKSAHPLFVLSVSLFVGGGIGNMIDRISIGKVIDFIAFRFGSYRFPNFNVADSCVTVGAILFLLYCLISDDELFADKKKKKAEASQTDSREDSDVSATETDPS